MLTGCYLENRGAKLCRRHRDLNTGTFQRINFLLSAALAARNNSPSVTHPSTGRSTQPGNEGSNRLPI